MQQLIYVLSCFSKSVWQNCASLYPSNRQIFSTSFLTCASGCIRLCLLLSLVAQENTVVQAPSCWRGCFLSNLRRARNSWGIDADKGAAEKIGEGSVLLLGRLLIFISESTSTACGKPIFIIIILLFIVIMLWRAEHTWSRAYLSP